MSAPALSAPINLRADPSWADSMTAITATRVQITIHCQTIGLTATSTRVSVTLAGLIGAADSQDFAIAALARRKRRDTVMNACTRLISNTNAQYASSGSIKWIAELRVPKKAA